MKLKDYWKLNRDIRDENVNRYLKENNIPREFYEEGKRKDKNLCLALACGAATLLFALCCIGSCAPKAVTTTPLKPVEKALVIQEPLSAFSSGEQFVIHNRTNSEVQYYNSGSSGNVVVGSNKDAVCFYDGGDTRQNINLFTTNEDDVFFVPIGDRYNYGSYWSIDYGESYPFDSFNVTPTDFYIMDNDIQNDKLDFSLYNDLRPSSQFAKMVIGYQYISTSESVDYVVEYNMSAYRLHYTDDYANLPDIYNILRFEYTILPNGHGYQYIVEVFAKYNSYYMTKIASNLETSEVSLTVTDTLIDYEAANTSNSIYGNSMRAAPYLVDTSIKAYTGSALSLPSSSKQIRGLFNTTSNIGKTNVFRPNSNTDLWDSIGDLIKVTFIAIWPIGDIYILPMVTIGALIFTPLIVAFIMLIIKVLRK